MNKNKILNDLIELIKSNSDEIILRNKQDIASARNLDHTLIDRLKVDEGKVDSMVKAIEEVIGIEDPEFKLLSEYKHPNGMLVQNRIVPFGNILIIYESRPDVTIEAAISAFKAGNKIFLKGGKEARNTNLFLVELWHKALSKNKVSLDYIQYFDVSREETQRIIKDNPYRIDLIIPRGGEGLINYIKSNTDIPLLISGRGNNFIFIDEEVDFEMAINLVLNGKSRLSVCNAIDKVIIHKELPNLKDKLELLKNRMIENKIEIIGSPDIAMFLPELPAIDDERIYYEEFLSAKLMFAMANNLNEAIEMINKYSGGHSAVIVTTNKENAREFQNKVDCAAVYHNASSRFTDGGQFGMGAEIAISTQKMHFRGPLGLSQLVSNKWFINGDGQIR